MSSLSRAQWTNADGDVLIVKCVPLDGRVTGQRDGGGVYDFTWPLTVGAIVEAPDWDPATKCGGGLHGWPWGFYIGDGKEADWSATWLVFAAKPADVIDLGGKVKARAGRIVYVGDWQGAMNCVLCWRIYGVCVMPDPRYYTGEPDARDDWNEPNERDIRAAIEAGYWSAYQWAEHEGWGVEWLLDHADREDLPASLRRAIPMVRRVRRTR